jgi:Protein kinase domain/PEGA domain
MIRKIGKYEVRERIGRGGMGMVFKAHDPVLDRAVAIKLISDDVDVTEELRARFFREAQACAKLSHPNIVTVYDMGELDGRLYIVMEFLEGEDLRHLIAQRRRLALEDKLALMIQVCDGLHYAHQKGVVHRDIKPGNVIVLSDGVAKIVDFGIAYDATLGGGLTRTGLFMGSLRYSSPEQAQGRADQRSDMFSLGTVFYELLAYRPALTGADPMHLLEQLRTEEPTPLAELDAAIPADLSAVIARAMRKNPTERFADLGEMRLALESVQLRLAGEATDVRQRIGKQTERARRLQAALAERTGSAAFAEDLPAIPTRARLDTLLGLENEFGERAKKLEQLLGKADAVAPAVQRGLSHLDAGRFADAIADFESVLAELPGHAHAATALGNARRRAEEERLRQRVVQRLDEARTAFERRAYRACLGVLAEMVAEAERFGLGHDAAGLRVAAEAGLRAEEAARQEELHRQRDIAQAALALMEEARSLAHDVDVARRAEMPWHSAESKAADGLASLDREAFLAAAEAFAEATALYHGAEEAAREVVRREELQRAQADRALQRMTQQQTAAQTVDAERRAEIFWARAIAKASDGQGAFSQEAFLRATEAFEEAAALFRRAEEAAREDIRTEELARQRSEAEQAQAAMAEAREMAQAVEARRRAASLWQAAEAREVAANEALSRNAYTQAMRLLREAGALYADGARTAGAVRQQEQEQAEQGLERALQWRTRAEAAASAELAPTLWTAAETRMAEGREALSAESYLVATRQVQEGEDLYRRAVQDAEALLRRQQEQALHRRELAVERRYAATGQGAAARSAEIWREAEARMAEADAALDDGRRLLAGDMFSDAAELFGQAEAAARDAIQREEQTRRRELAERTLGVMEMRRAEAAQPEASRRSASAWLAAEERAEEGRRALDEGRYSEAALIFQHATDLFREAEDSAREMARREALSRERDDAERARQSMATARLYRRGADAARQAMVDTEGTIVADPTRGGEIDQTIVVPHEPATPPSRPAHDVEATVLSDAIAVVAPGAGSGSVDADRAEDTLPVLAPTVAGPEETLAPVRAHQDVEATMLGDATLVAEQKRLDGTDRGARSFVPRSDVVAAEAPTAIIGPTAPDQATILGLAADERTLASAVPLEEPGQRASRPILSRALVAGIATVALLGATTTWVLWPRSTPAPIPPRGVPTHPDPVPLPASPTPPASPAPPGPVAREPVPSPGAQSKLKASVPPAPSKPRPTPPEPKQPERSPAPEARVIPPPEPTPPPGPPKAKLLAEERREAAKAARIEAERAGAKTNAGQSLERARNQEAQAEEAFGRQDYERAVDGFGLALATYLNAKAAVDALRGRMEAAKTEAAQAHREAIDAKATELARDAFGDALAREREAEALSRQEFSPAIQVFTDAARLFRQSTSRARALGELRSQAEQARERMRNEKQQAGRRSDTSDYRAAISKEEEGERSYARLLFAEAREAFTVATDLYAKAAAIPPPAPRPTTGGLLITTNVPGAAVWVANRKIQPGADAVEVRDLSPGRYPVKASANGFKEWTGQIEIVAGRRTELVISLERRQPYPLVP